MTKALILALCALLLPLSAQADQAKLGGDVTTGVAPLAVLFDASGSEDSSVADPFHQLTYTFEFGEKRKNANYDRRWGLDGDDFLGRLSKDRYVGGPLAGHVYETPGTYTATVTARDPAGNTTNATLTITVQDPDDRWSGTQTVCQVDAVKPDSFVGCPGGAARVTNANFAAAGTVASANKRVLLRRGDTFTGSATINPTTDGMIGAFGTGARPRVNGGDTVLKIGGSGARVVDLDLVSSCTMNCPLGNGTTEALSTTVAMKRALFLRVKTTNGFGGYSAKGGSIRHQWHAVDCEFGRVADRDDGKEGGKQMDGDISRTILLGNLLGVSPKGFNARFYGADHVVFAFNRFAGSHHESKPAIRFHGSANYPTERFIFAYNTYGPDMRATLEVKPASSSFYNVIRNYIVEGNYIPHGQEVIQAFGQDVSIRNNIKKGGGTGGPGPLARTEPEPMAPGKVDQGFSVQYPTRNVWISGNSCYFTSASAGPCLDVLSGTATPVEARDNLLYAPARASGTVARGFTTTGGNRYIGSGSPSPFQVASPTRIIDYRSKLGVGASFDLALEQGGGTPLPQPPLPPVLVDLREVK